jgi:hypothetical protein
MIIQTINPTANSAVPKDAMSATIAISLSLFELKMIVGCNS